MKKIIGYQICRETELPKGLFSFMLFKTLHKAMTYLIDNSLDRIGFNVLPIFEGQVENPTFI